MVIVKLLVLIYYLSARPNSLKVNQLNSPQKGSKHAKEMSMITKATGVNIRVRIVVAERAR